MPSSLVFRAPPLALLISEPFRAFLECSAAGIGCRDLVEGDGHPVILYPGLGAGSLNTSQLRTHLASCGFDVHDWELGVNTGPEGAFDDWLQALVRRVQELHERSARKVSLVGWSLGGIYAREIAKCCPGSVRQVVTLATPHKAVGDANHAGTIYRMLGGSTSQLTPELLARLGRRPPVPVTSVYSESDGVVCWQACLEEPCASAENIPVHASHLGMPTHPDVLRIVANRLAQPEGRWRPWRAGLKSRSTGSSRSRK